MERKHYQVEDMYNFSVEVLKKAGYPEKSAEATAYALLDADKKGIFSHGIAGGTGLEEAVKRSGAASTVNPKAEPEVLESKYAAVGIIDANGAPGHISSMMAVDLVKDLARKYGMAKVYVNNANHFGAAGVWSDKIAEDNDLEGVVTCTTAACARIMGDDSKGLDYTQGAGKEERLGTNPTATTIPHKDGKLTLDMANTRMAASYCIRCMKEGKMMEIPSYVFDKDNKTTYDPNDFIAVDKDRNKIIKGSIAPLGSEAAGYKGDAILRMIEIDNAVGGGPTKKIPLGGKGKERRISHTFEATAMDILYDKNKALEKVSELMTDVEKYFGEKSRWPGDRSKQAIDYATQNGIPYSEGQVETLKRAAEHVGFDFKLKPVSIKEFPAEVFKK